MEVQWKEVFSRFAERSFPEVTSFEVLQSFGFPSEPMIKDGAKTELCIDLLLEPEGDALVLAARHVLRSSQAFGRRIVALVDNLPLALAATKGRARSRHLRGPLRELAALGLASGSRFYVRWIASELDPSDPCSRGL